MQARRSVGIDLDGTLADTTSRWTEIASETIGRKVRKSDITEYSISQALGITYETVMDIFKKTWQDHAAIRLEDGRIPVILSRINQHYDTYITTATNASPEAVREWVVMHGIKVNCEIIHLDSSSKKAHLDIDILIDDHPDVAVHAASLGKTAILIRQPWNESLAKSNDSSSIHVAEDWGHIERLLLRELRRA